MCKDRSSSAVDHCPNVAVTIRSFIYLFASHDFLLDVCVCVPSISICLYKTHAFSLSSVSFYIQCIPFPMIQLGGRSCTIFSLSLGSPRNW